MVHIVIDRRKNDKGKSSDNRRRFVRRVKEQVRDAVKDVIRRGSIKEIVSNKGKKITIPGKGLSKPSFNHSTTGGTKDRVLPGNKQFSTGDRSPRSKSGAGKGPGKGASNSGEGEDAFQFTLTRDEFLEIFFEDLELPDMVIKEIVKLDDFVMKRAGFSVDGPPSRLNIVRSMKLAKGRRFALRTPKKKELKELEKQLLMHESSLKTCSPEEDADIKATIVKLVEQIKVLKRQIRAIPFLDDVDLRYNRWDKFPNPTTQAVMFGIMDVSGSMTEWHKEMAKRFFMLLLLFLHYNYQTIDIVWIRHHTIATEVEEDEFFYAGDTGGTLVSPAIKLMSSIIADRYPPHLWNIFGCQISDGDNWNADTPTAIDVLNKEILPVSRFFSYVEIDQTGSGRSDLWAPYEALKATNPNMEMSVIQDVSKIYDVFRSLFEKRKT